MSDDATKEVLRQELDKICGEIDSIGGLSSYQEASKLGQSVERGGDSAKVLIVWLREEGTQARR